MRALPFIDIKKKSKHTPKFVLQKSFMQESYVYKKVTISILLRNYLLLMTYSNALLTLNC